MFTIFMIAFIGSFLSGMVGIGGAIIKYPMLLYIPPFLGFSAFTAHEVAGLNAIQVFFATLAGMLTFRKGGYLNKNLTVIMGVSILIGSFAGAYGSNFLSNGSVNLIYAILAALAAIMIILPRKSDEYMIDDNEVNFNKVLAAILALIIGVGSGIVGAGGGFILVPIMLVVLKIPTKITIATSLAIVFISSIGSTIGKVATGQIILIPAIIMIIASLIAAPIGANLSKKTNPKVLQGILAIIIISTTIKIWIDIL